MASNGMVTFTSPSGKSTLLGYLYRPNGTGDVTLNRTLEAAVTVPRNAEAGTWSVTKVELADNANNRTVLDGAALATAGFPTGFEQTNGLPGAPTAVSAVAGNGSATVNVEGLTNGVAYSFTVAALNPAGTGAESAPSAAVTPVVPVTVPGAPTGVSAVAGKSSATVSWSAPASDGGSPFTSYQVTAYAGTTAVKTVIVTAGTTVLVDGLTSGTSYTFKVAATNAVGTGADSAASAAVTPKAGNTSTKPPKGK